MGSRPVMALVLLAASIAVAEAAPAIVLCAPGYPGSSAEAQPTMDAFARVVAGAASIEPNTLAARYFESESAGAERLRQPDAPIAIVTLPFYLKYRKELALTPRLRVVAEEGAAEVWSLVAKRGSVTSPASLDGWQVVGIPSYSPDFVRGPILGAWGKLPGTTRLVFSARVPSSLVKAAAGQPLAVLVDSAQAAALPAHPNGKDLEVVARSKPLPGSVVCLVGAPASRATDALVAALAALGDRPEAREVLRSMRLRRFEPLDGQALNAALSIGAEPPRAP